MIEDGIAYDDWGRLRNALVALADMDPSWMVWVERHVPRGGDVRITLRIVERRARQLIARKFFHLGEFFMRGVVDSDYYFTDNGDLKTFK